MREIKLRGLVENISTGHRQWVFYGVGSKPSLCGMIWVVEDEQFIDQHDIDGKEIYEGDKVEDEFGETREIKWFTDLGYDGGGARHSGFYYDITYEGVGSLEYHNSLMACKVIGNIHEQ